jgi:hypothetical protein
MPALQPAGTPALLAALYNFRPMKKLILILVKGAPGKNIADIENLQVVFKDGVGYDPQKLIDAVRGRVGQN